MPHIFFNKLEKRESTQSFFPLYQYSFNPYNSSFGSPSNVLIYAIGVSDPSTNFAPYGFGSSYQYPWSSNWGWPSWGSPQISPWPSPWSSPWQSNWGWSSPWGFPQSSSWSYPGQSNWGWSSSPLPWSSSWSSNWGGYTPLPSNPPWSPNSQWTGSDSSYPPGTLYGLIKRANLQL